jgi:DNA-binding transcriptional ArsR family regulator
MADPARAVMLTALLDGRPLAAGELARLAGVSAATASAHLARLLQGGLVAVESQGRHRYYRLAGHEVTTAIEALAHLSHGKPARSLRHSQQAAALGSARTCYDHLAGRAGVALFDALLAHGIITRTRWPEPKPELTPGPDNVPAPQAQASPETLQVTAPGEARLGAFGINMQALRRSRRRLAGECLDWTERRPHLNGALGAALTARMLELGWLERNDHNRAVRVTGAGRDGLAATFGCSPDA